MDVIIVRLDLEVQVSLPEGPILHDGELLAECRERAIETALCAIPQEANIYIKQAIPRRYDDAKRH